MKSTRNSFVLGLGIAMFGGFLVYSAFQPAASTSGNRSATSSNHGSVMGANNDNADQAPDFSLSTIDGNTVSLSDYKGDKPVVLDFFATWCHNCQRSMPQLSRMYDKYKGQIEIIGVNLRENQSTVQSFISSRGISFPIALDPSGVAASQYGVRYTNTHVLIDRDGNLVKTIPGDLRESDITALINS